MRLVDADYIKESVKRQCDNCRKEGMKWMADSVERAIIEELDNTPTAHPQWIPCSERLPDSGRYLVSCSLSVFSPQVVNYDADDGEWFYDGCKSIGYEMPTIHAWMPLPKPYRGESDV